MRTSFVLFMDFLGVKQMWTSSAPEEIAKQLLFVNRYAEELETLTKTLKSGLSPLASQAVTFSDNVAVAFPINETAMPLLSEFFEGKRYTRPIEEYYKENSAENAMLDGIFDWVAFINDLGTFQLRLTAEGYPLRGAFTFGPVFAEPGLIAGPAIVDAAVCESEKVQMPLIAAPDEIVDIRNADMQAYGGRNHSYFDKFFAHTSFFDSEHEGHFIFVSYLEWLRAGPYPQEGERNLLLEHRDMIVENLENTNGKVRLKYVWLARYHNWFCTRYADIPQESYDSTSIAEHLISESAEGISFMSLSEYASLRVNGEHGSTAGN